MFVPHASEIWKKKSYGPNFTKFLHYLKKYLDHMLVKFEQNRMVQTVQNFDIFDKKRLIILDKVLTLFWKTFLWFEQLYDA